MSMKAKHAIRQWVVAPAGSSIIVLACMLEPAHANSQIGWNAAAAGQAPLDNQSKGSNNTSQIAVSGSYSVQPYFAGDIQTSSAFAEGSVSYVADYGHLGASTAASATVTDVPVPPANYGRIQTSSWALGSADVSFYDEILPTSATLAYGSTLIVNFSIPLDGSTITSGNSPYQLYSQVYSDYDVDGTFGRLTPVFDASGNYTGEVTGSFSATIGLMFQVAVGLHVESVAEAGNNYYSGMSASTSASFMNTEHLFLDSADDVTLLASSGHDYNSPALTVSEPASGILLTSGMSIFALLRRKSRTRLQRQRQR